MSSSHNNHGARRDPTPPRPDDLEADSNGGLEIEIDLDLSGEEPAPRPPLRPPSPQVYPHPAQTPSAPRGARYQPTLQPPPPTHRAPSSARATPNKLPALPAAPPPQEQHEDLSEIFAAADPLAFGVELVPDDLQDLGISDDFDPWADIAEPGAARPQPASVHNKRTNPGAAAPEGALDLLDLGQEEDGDELGDYGRQLMALGSYDEDDGLDAPQPAPMPQRALSSFERPTREVPSQHARPTREMPQAPRATPNPDASYPPPARAAVTTATSGRAAAAPAPPPTPQGPSRPSPRPTPVPSSEPARASAAPSAGFAALARPTPRSKTLDPDSTAPKSSPAVLAATPSQPKPQAEVLRRHSSYSARPASLERPALVDPDEDPSSVAEESATSGRAGILRRQSSKPQRRPEGLLPRTDARPTSHEDDLQHKLDRAQILRRGGLHEEAEALLRDLLQSNPDNSQVRHLFALNEENRAERTIARLGDLSVVPRLLIKPQDLTRRARELDSRLGYLVTLIDGLSTLQDVLELSPMNKEETAELLLYLRKQGIMSGGGR